MAAPLITRVRLPDDTTNGGKYVEYQSEIDSGGFAVLSHRVVARSRRKIVGMYPFVMGVQSIIAAAQNGTTTGFLWMSMPVGSTTRARLRKLKLDFVGSGELDMMSVPRIVLARFTFTLVPAGALLAPTVRRITAPTNDFADAVPNHQLFTTSVTWVPVLYTVPPVGANAWSCQVPTLSVTTSGVAWLAGPISEFDPTDEEEFLDFGPGEGLVLYQPDAATAADTRRFGLSGMLDEYDNA